MNRRFPTLRPSGPPCGFFGSGNGPELPGCGHIAFVGNSSLDLFSNTPISDQIGKKGTDLNASKFWPILVQAGTFSGVTSINYGTSDWFKGDRVGIYKNYREYLLAEKLYFYRVKGGK